MSQPSNVTQYSSPLKTAGAAILDFANSEIRASINGGAFDTAPANFGVSTLTPGVTVGTVPDIVPSRSANSECIGLLDDVAIWKTALTPENVEWLQQNSLHDIRKAGDFDSDGDVDGADFVAWQTNFPKATDALLSEGDADGDGEVAGADFVVWQTNFPFAPGPGTAFVPEPTALFLEAFGVIGIVGFAGLRWSKRK
jgi:hypothetical protein